MKEILSKTKRMKEVEEEHNESIEEILRNLYVDHNLPVLDIAYKLKISYPTCTHWLKLAGVYSRKINF